LPSENTSNDVGIQ
jgi:hypothetical protein